MKRILALSLILLMLAACVPTPEVDAVKQKDTNVLIDTVIKEEEERIGIQEQAGEAVSTPTFKCRRPAKSLWHK